MPDAHWLWERALDNKEAMALIQGVEPTTLVDAKVGHGDIAFDFELPDGRLITYTAEMEDDYYGGSYLTMAWHLYRLVEAASPITEEKNG